MSDMKLQPRVKSPSRDTADSDFMKLLRGTRTGEVFVVDWLTNLAMQGRIFFSSDADQNDVVTGQTSFANTTPTFLLKVPAGTTAIPLGIRLAQAGSVAGGAIDIIIEVDKIERYSTGGTSEKVASARTDTPVANQCTLYTGATAVAGYGMAIKHIMQIPADVAPAITEGYDWHQVEWYPAVPQLLVGPAAWLIYTYAGTTGPSWDWVAIWAEIPSSDIT